MGNQTTQISKREQDFVKAVLKRYSDLTDGSKSFLLDVSVIYSIAMGLENMPRVFGLNNSFTYEIKANYKAAPNQRVIAGITNCYITLGADRSGDGVGTGFGGLGHQAASAIDIVAGHKASRPLPEIFGVKVYQGPDFKDDACRIYLSQKCKIDEYFDIPLIFARGANRQVAMESGKAAAGIGIKSDNVRIIGRNTIKIVTNHKSSNSKLRREGDCGVDIIAGYNQVAYNPVLSLQPMVKGNNLVELLKKMLLDIHNVRNSLVNFMNMQKTINEQMANHVHQSGAPGLLTNSPLGENSAIRNFLLMTKIIPDVLKCKIEEIVTGTEYFSVIHEKCITSAFNRVN